MLDNCTLLIIIIVVFFILYLGYNDCENFSAGGALIQLTARDPQDSYEMGGDVSKYYSPYYYYPYPPYYYTNPYFWYTGRVPRRYRY